MCFREIVKTIRIYRTKMLKIYAPKRLKLLYSVEEFGNKASKFSPAALKSIMILFKKRACGAKPPHITIKSMVSNIHKVLFAALF